MDRHAACPLGFPGIKPEVAPTYGVFSRLRARQLLAEPVLSEVEWQATKKAAGRSPPPILAKRFLDFDQNFSEMLPKM